MRFEMKRKEQESVKRDKIIGYIRSRILSGEWSEGTPLPPRTWFGKLFNAAPLTIQRAFQVLLDEKILIAKERIGTRVADHLPNPARFALLLYGSPKRIACHTAALIEAGKRLAEKGFLVEPHFVLESYPEELMKSNVITDLTKQCYAGAFFEASGIWGTPEFWKRLEAVPVTGFLCEDFYLPNMLPCRTEDKTEEFVLSMFRHLKESGAHRVAGIISGTEYCRELFENFRLQAAQFGLECPESCYLALPNLPCYGDWFKNMIRNLFAPDRTAMPDALILQNESLLSDICGVLHEFYGERAHQLVRIASVGNSPVLPKVDYPVFFFGYDMLRTLENALNAVMNLRRGKAMQFPEVVLFDQKVHQMENGR